MSQPLPKKTLTILMPCLNEEETLETCILKAQKGIEKTINLGLIEEGEILIADNGSTDQSIAIAERLGARVEKIQEKGYGSALQGGIASARGQWILMGDSDASYDFEEAPKFVARLQEGQGYDLVMGCRLPSGGGRVLPGAMPWKNRWIGNPILTFIGRLLFECPAHDFHCGLRGFSREAILELDLQTSGMEFASEMVIKATLQGLRISEVPTTLHPDGRSRPPHLKPWRDGWRHLRFMLLYSPKWLFLVPGAVLSLFGGALAGILSFEDLQIAGARLNIGALALSFTTLLLGVQLLLFAVFTKTFGTREGLLAQDPLLQRLWKVFTLERGVVLSLGVFLFGALLLTLATLAWAKTGFADMPWQENLRLIIPGGSLALLGLQGIFSSFFLSILGLKKTHPRQSSTQKPSK
jgi:glycosyltransferase involved in cell wall biosynthesis